MDILTKCTLKEIDLFEQHVNISTTSEENIKITDEVANQLMHDLNTEIWNEKNIEECHQYCNKEQKKSLAYLWGSPDLTNISNYAGRYAFYLDEVILDEPITVNLLKTPYHTNDVRLSLIAEGIASVIKSREWFEEGIMKMLPVSTKFWFENYEAKRYMTDKFPTIIEDELKFIMDKTSIIEKFAHAIIDNDPSTLYDDLKFMQASQAMIEGQVLEVEQSLYFSQFLDLIPTVNDFDQWQVLNWRLRKDNKNIPKEWTNTFALKNIELHYLDNLPVDIAIKIREGGYGAELRSFFREKFNDIHGVDDIQEFQSLTSDISSEINDEIAIYEKDITNLKDTYINVGGKAAIGLMAVALGAYFGRPLEALSTFATGISYVGLDEIRRLRKKQNNCLNLLLEAKNYNSTTID